MTVPALKEIRRIFPRARIDLAARPWVGGLFAHAPYVDRVVAFDKGGPHAGLRGRWRFARDVLAPERYDLAILLQNAIEAALLAWLARIPRRAGYPTDARRALLTHALPEPRPDAPTGRHHARRYLHLLSAGGWSDVDYLAADYRPDIRLALDRDLPAIGEALLARVGAQPSGPLVVFHAGAAFGPAKRWPQERWEALAARLGATGRRVWVFGAEGEAGEGAAIAAAAGDRAANLCGRTTLGDVVDLMARCSHVVTNDSGLMHVAAASGPRVVALFGSTSPRNTPPLDARARVVWHALECSPCYARTCPLGHLRCLTGIDVDEVMGHLDDAGGDPLEDA